MVAVLARVGVDVVVEAVLANEWDGVFGGGAWVFNDLRVFFLCVAQVLRGLIEEGIKLGL
jgi:hypothetical protein